jgi:heme exporter protein B
MRGLLVKIFAIFWKDLLSEFRTRELITSILVFALLVLVIFNFAFDPDTGVINTVAPGILWVSLTFAGVLGLNRTFVSEKADAGLEGLMLCPVDRAAIYWGKLLSSFVFMLTVAFIITPVFLVLLNLPLILPGLALIIVLATLGFAAIGTLFSALAINTRARDVMLPILFLPTVIPVIIAAVEATELVLKNELRGDMLIWIQIIIGFDIIYLVVSTLVFEHVIQE